MSDNWPCPLCGGAGTVPVNEDMVREALAVGPKETVQKALGVLTWREVNVIKLRFVGVEGHTYNRAEVGKILKVTRERVRAVEANAIRKLLRPQHRDIFVDKQP